MPYARFQVNPQLPNNSQGNPLPPHPDKYKNHTPAEIPAAPNSGTHQRADNRHMSMAEEALIYRILSTDESYGRGAPALIRFD
jgi:hypothetical protein